MTRPDMEQRPECDATPDGWTARDVAELAAASLGFALFVLTLAAGFHAAFGKGI